MLNYGFHLVSEQSPTYHNLARHLKTLGWHARNEPREAHLHAEHFNFDKTAAEQLEFKHLFAELLTRHHPDFIPSTYCMDDHSWPSVIAALPTDNRYQWILKPALLNNGQYIKLFSLHEQILQHFSTHLRLGGPHVLQRYINTPDLLRGHKYSLRLFVAITSAQSYLYPHGYLNVARLPYQHEQWHDLRPHLTNEHLIPHEINVHQIPTSRWPAFTEFYPQLKTMLEYTIAALRHSHPQAFSPRAQQRIALFGFDFLLDHTKRAWLLEANHAPCFPRDVAHPLQQYLYHDFWRALIHDVLYPLLDIRAAKTTLPYRFECI